MTLDPTSMMSLVKGEFSGTTPPDLSKLFTKFKEGPHRTLLVHLHGGLVGEEAAIKNAIDLNDQYSASAACLFPIWHTGIFEVLGQSWAQIAQDTVFQVALDRVMSAVWAKAKETVGFRGLTLDYQPGTFLTTDLVQSSVGEGDVVSPLAGIDLSALEPLTGIQERQLEMEFARDSKLVGEFHAAIAAHVGTAEEATRAAFSDPLILPKKSMMDEAALDELAAESTDTRGIPVGVALKILGIVKDVILRFVQRKDHGLHATATEEVLRSFYGSVLGQRVWGQMKVYAKDAFKPGPTFGGTALIAEIADLPPGKEVLLVGHSAGAIFICEMLLAMKAAGVTKPVDVVFLAPAVRMDLFAEALAEAQPSIRNFRMFTMSDENECKDVLVRTDDEGSGAKWFYPRSLLYFIAGILENEVDSPIVGMARFYDPNVWNGGDPSVGAVQAYIASGTARGCWSISQNADPRLCANAVSHGDFGHSLMTKDEPNSTVAGICDIIQSGF